MQVTFVGGPSHGKTIEMEAPAERLWVNDGHGGKFLYAVRTSSLEGVGHRPMYPVHVWYAAQNIDQEEYLRLLASIPSAGFD